MSTAIYLLTLGFVMTASAWGSCTAPGPPQTFYVSTTGQNTNDGLTVKAIINPGAIYGVEDANVRVAGATLDLASGGLGVAATSNADFIVVADSAADEPTLVMFNNTHYLKT